MVRCTARKTSPIHCASQLRPLDQVYPPPYAPVERQAARQHGREFRLHRTDIQCRYTMRSIATQHPPDPGPEVLQPLELGRLEPDLVSPVEDGVGNKTTHCVTQNPLTLAVR